jgi:hypothetical protein
MFSLLKTSQETQQHKRRKIHQHCVPSEESKVAQFKPSTLEFESEILILGRLKVMHKLCVLASHNVSISEAHGWKMVAGAVANRECLSSLEDAQGDLVHGPIYLNRFSILSRDNASGYRTIQFESEDHSLVLTHQSNLLILALVLLVPLVRVR